MAWKGMDGLPSKSEVRPWSLLPPLTLNLVPQGLANAGGHRKK